jgi:hypothetical protein
MEVEGFSSLRSLCPCGELVVSGERFQLSRAVGARGSASGLEWRDAGAIGARSEIRAGRDCADGTDDRNSLLAPKSRHGADD